MNWGLSAQNIPQILRRGPLIFSNLSRFELRAENPRVGGSIPPLATFRSGSVPVTSLTIYTGDIADTLALKGLKTAGVECLIQTFKCSNSSNRPLQSFRRALTGRSLLYKPTCNPCRVSAAEAPRPST
jgi:hypothetical protein